MSTQTLTRKDMEPMLDCGHALVDNLLKEPGAPRPITRIGQSLVYRAEDVYAWLQTNPRQRYTNSRKKAPAKAPETAKRAAFDNQNALTFLIRPPLDDEKRITHTKHGTSTTEHIKERNEYIPPHSGLSDHRSQTGCEYRGLSLMGAVFG